MDEQYVITTVRYIELNPVKAGIVKRSENYKWSSTQVDIQCEDDILVKVEPLLSIIPDWQELLTIESVHRRVRKTAPA